MPPLLALALALGYVAFSLRAECRFNSHVSPAVWIPTVWLLLIGTRYLSQWLSLGSGPQSISDAIVDGSPLDVAVFIGLYVAALMVLARRRISFARFVGLNTFLIAFLAYGLISVLWSDYPVIAFKRWVKVTEHVAMALVVVTDPRLSEALDALFRRFAYIVVPLSVLFIKYFPQFGRGFEYWTGAAINVGVTTDKNALGHICLIGGLWLCSRYLSRPEGSVRTPLNIVLLDAVTVACIIWLLYIANAKTALVCFMLGILLLTVLGWTRLGKSAPLIILSLLGGVIFLTSLEALFDLGETVIRSLDRDPTLTDRTQVWKDVLHVPINAVVGTGFESFWLGRRLESLWDKYWWQPNQSHNGYIETYVNLGVVGVVLLTTLIVAGFANALRFLKTDRQIGHVRLAFLIAILLFNYTDATFKGLHVLNFVFFLIVLAYPQARQRAPLTAIEVSTRDARRHVPT